MRLITMVASATLALTLATAACGKSEAKQAGAGEAATTAEAGSPAAGDEAKALVEVETKAEVKAGADGHATVTFKPATGYKWNKEYPAKLTITNSPTHVKLAKKEFKQLSGDFTASEKMASVKIPLEGLEAGADTIEADAKLSVCNDTTCRIEKAKVVVKVAVR